VLRSYERLLVENRRYRSNGGRLTQNFNHSSFSENYDKCSFVLYVNLDRSFYRFVTMHACDGRTDGQTDRQTDRNLLAIPRLHYMQRGKNAVAGTWQVYLLTYCAVCETTVQWSTLERRRLIHLRWWALTTTPTLLLQTCEGGGITDRWTQIRRLDTHVEMTAFIFFQLVVIFIHQSHGRWNTAYRYVHKIKKIFLK